MRCCSTYLSQELIGTELVIVVEYNPQGPIGRVCEGPLYGDLIGLVPAREAGLAKDGRTELFLSVHESGKGVGLPVVFRSQIPGRSKQGSMTHTHDSTTTQASTLQQVWGEV